MSDNDGNVTMLGEKAVKWLLGSKSSSGRWISDKFSVSEFSDLFFAVQPDEPGYGILGFCEKDVGTSKTCDLIIILRYRYGIKSILLENCKPTAKEKWNVYVLLADIEIDNLKEIFFIFLKIELLSETDVQIEQQENAEGVEEDSENVERNKLKYQKDFTKLSEDLKSAFLSEEDSDIIVRVGDKTYPAHKMVLRNRSSVFRAMLEHDMTEKNEDSIEIKDCDPIIFRDFLQYLYSGRTDISNGNVFELYYASDKYDVNLLKMNCVDYIVNNLSIDIICDVIALATKHSESNLLKQSIEFFIENAEEIFVTVHWQEFLMANPIQANELIIKSFKSGARKQKPTT